MSPLFSYICNSYYNFCTGICQSTVYPYVRNRLIYFRIKIRLFPFHTYEKHLYKQRSFFYNNVVTVPGIRPAVRAGTADILNNGGFLQ